MFSHGIKGMLGKKLFGLLAWLLANPLWAMDLVQAYHLALRNDLPLRAAEAQHRAGLEQAVQGRANLLPQLSLEARSSWGQTQYETGVGDIEQNQENRTYGVQLVQPLFHWQSWVQYQQGGQAAALATVRLDHAHQDLLLRVAEAYLGVLSFYEVLGALEQLRTADAAQLASARKQFELGNVSIADVHEAQASFDRVSAQLIQALNDIELARHSLARLVGQPPQRLAGLGADVGFDPPQPNHIDTWIELARQHNFDVQARDLLLSIAQHEVRSRKAEHLPTLDLVVSHNMQEHPSFGTERSESSSIGLHFSMPLYAGGRSSSAVREASALYVQAETELEDARRGAALAVREAWQGVVGGMAQIRALEAARTSAQSALDANRLGFRIGLRVSTDVLEAQSQLAEIMQQLARERYDTLLAQLRLKAAAGSLDEADLYRVNSLLTVMTDISPTAQPIPGVRNMK